MSLTQGTRLGPYEILSPLGAGGMGEVYRARDTKLGRDVAIKVLPEEFFEEKERIARFEREAKSLAAVSHPHIAALYSFEEISGRHLLVMELVEGETLADRLLKGPLPPDQVLKTGIEIASALDAAHRAGIVHRDLKPGNVMLTRSGVKLLDFGLAKALAPEGPVESLTSAPTTARDVTREGEILGTLSYMAPEQLEGKKPDSRTDIFALGATLYEMATGRKAFTGTSQASLITAIMTSEPQPISVVQPMTPPALDRVVKTCLAKDPDDRWQSAHDVKLQLQSIADGGSQVGFPRLSSPRARAGRGWPGPSRASVWLPRWLSPSFTSGRPRSRRVRLALSSCLRSRRLSPSDRQLLRPPCHPTAITLLSRPRPRIGRLTSGFVRSIRSLLRSWPERRRRAFHSGLRIVASSGFLRRES